MTTAFIVLAVCAAILGGVYLDAGCKLVAAVCTIASIASLVMAVSA